MSVDARRLMELLPAIHRIRDAEQGGALAGPLEGLLAAIAEQIAVIEEDLAQLYDDHFVETCADWVVPYIGDLIGVRGLHDVAARVSSPRAEVANTIGYRRRKGTAAMLEQLARDVTGWNARVVELFELLGWTQYMQHVRPGRGGTLDLRDHAACELVTVQAGAFDRSARTADVRRIASGRGRHNIPNVGIFLWRLQHYPVERSDARQVAPGCYTFHPLGLDAPLFNRPQVEVEATHLAEPGNVPEPLRRRPLYDELEALRQAIAEGRDERALIEAGLYFGPEPVLRVFRDGDEVPAREVLVCDLSDPAPPISEVWRRPPTSRSYTPRPGSAAPPVAVSLPIGVAVDPVLGRIAFPAGVVPEEVQVSYAYGFSGDVGGGPYDRSGSIPAGYAERVRWQMGVSREIPPVAGEIVQTLAEAVQAWNAQPPGTTGALVILDSRSYVESLTGTNQIRVPEGSQLLVVAGDWPEVEVPGAVGVRRRVVGQFTPAGPRPHLRGNLSVVGVVGGESWPSALLLNGLLVEGVVTVLAGDLGHLDVSHSTVAPGPGRLVVNGSLTPNQQNSRLRTTIDHSICGRVTMPDTVAGARVVASVIHSAGAAAETDPAIELAGVDLEVEASTVVGTTAVGTLEASNSVFTGRVVAARRQAGCVRFSYLPLDSLAPRRHRCQPLTTSEAASVRPQFTSLRHGDPGFAQLAGRCPEEILRGADDESEMGVFHDLFGPQREANLRARLDEYLRFGLEAGVFYAT